MTRTPIVFQASTALGWAAVIISLGGCSSAIALTQYAEKSKHSSFEVGEHRTKVESRLGEPLTTDSYADGSMIATYQYKLNHPSNVWDSPGGRAFGYLQGIRVFFLSEVLFVPWEIGGKVYRIATRETWSLQVTYGPDDTVIGIEYAKAETRGVPAQGPEGAR